MYALEGVSTLPRALYVPKTAIEIMNGVAVIDISKKHLISVYL